MAQAGIGLLISAGELCIDLTALLSKEELLRYRWICRCKPRHTLRSSWCVADDDDDTCRHTI